MNDPARLPPLLRIGHPVADRAVLVGDPGRALALARTQLQGPLMSNHARGLWGYTGEGPDGERLSVMSVGTGGPSAVAVLHELVAAGVRRVVWAGSALDAAGALAPGSLRVVRAAVARDGTSRALGLEDGARVAPDATTADRLRRALRDDDGIEVVSVDLLPAHGGPEPPAAGAVDRQTAPLLAAASRLAVPAAAVLAFPAAAGTDEERDGWWQALGRAAVPALAG